MLAPVGAYLRVRQRFGEYKEFYVIREAADRNIPVNDKVIVQDITRGAERLYELNRKGWYVRNRQELANVEKYIKAGAVYLVLEEPMEEFDDSLKYYFSDCVERIGPLYCYPLKKDNDPSK